VLTVTAGLFDGFHDQALLELAHLLSQVANLGYVTRIQIPRSHGIRMAR